MPVITKVSIRDMLGIHKADFDLSAGANLVCGPTHKTAALVAVAISGSHTHAPYPMDTHSYQSRSAETTGASQVAATFGGDYSIGLTSRSEYFAYTRWAPRTLDHWMLSFDGNGESLTRRPVSPLAQWGMYIRVVNALGANAVTSCLERVLDTRVVHHRNFPRLGTSHKDFPQPGIRMLTVILCEIMYWGIAHNKPMIVVLDNPPVPTRARGSFLRRIRDLTPGGMQVIMATSTPNDYVAETLISTEDFVLNEY